MHSLASFLKTKVHDDSQPSGQNTPRKHTVRPTLITQTNRLNSSTELRGQFADDLTRIELNRLITLYRLCHVDSLQRELYRWAAVAGRTVAATAVL